MKKIAPLLMLLILSATSFSQQNDPAPTLTKQDYLAKSKKQKTGAWVLLSGGFVMSAIGAGLAIDDATEETYGAIVTIVSLGLAEPPVSDDKDNSTIASVLLLTGLGSMIGSIPLFKAAEKSKRKGMSLSFSNQRIPSLQKISFVYNSIPSLKLKISL